MLQKQKDIEFQKDFNNEVLLEKQQQIAFDREFMNEQMLQKQKDLTFQRDFNNEVLLARAKQIAEDKELTAAQLQEKLDKLEFDRQFQNEVLLQKQKDIAASKEARDRKIAQDQYIKNVKWNSKLLEDQHNAEIKRQKDAENERIFRDTTEFNAQLARIRREIKEAERAERERTRIAERGERERLRAYENAQRERERVTRARMTAMSRMLSFGGGRAATSANGIGASGLGGGLTARADIYMHTNAIRSTIEMARSLVNLRIQYRENEVAIEAFAGSSEKAAAVMRDIQQFAEVSPYSTIELAQAARNMMSFGVSTDETLKVMRHLGEVAGGSQFRLERLMFAMSQIVSTGKLMGNDLRQLTEQGFNPLKTIADKTKVSMDVLNKAKEEGLITDMDVINALKMETTGTGRFAGMLRKISNEMGGLMNQAKEGMRNTAMEFMKILEPAINQSLKRLLMFIESFRQFMKDNPERVTQIANLVKNIFLLKIGFHMLGLSVASVRWSATSLWATFKGLRIVALPLTVSLALLSSILGGIASTVTAIATGNVLGFVGSLFGMVKALAGLGAVGIGVALLRDYIVGKGGLKEAFRAMVIDVSILNEKMKGFFANIKENIGMLDNWFRANFDSIIDVVSTTADSMLTALIDNMMLVGSSLIEAFSIAFNWFLANLPMLIGKFKDAWKKSDTSKSVSDYAGLFVMSQFAAVLDFATGMLPFGLGPAIIGLNQVERGSTTPFKDMLATAVSKSPKFMGKNGNQAEVANKVFSEGMLGVGEKLLNGLKSGLEKVDLKGLKLPGLNFKIPEKPVKEPNLPDELAKFETDFKDLLARIDEMMKEPEKKNRVRKSDVYTVTEAMAFNSAQYEAASAEAFYRLREFQANQRIEKNPQLQEQITTNRHLEKLIEILKKDGPKLEVIGTNP